MRMWHHKFDPHSVPAIEPAELKPQSSKSGAFHRSESVKDFIDRTKLDRVMDKRARSPEDSNALAQMSAKTGLSLDTLRLIKQKQDAVQSAKEALKDSMRGEDAAKRQQTLVKVADQIR